jgi:hypothetical protein
MKHKTRKIQNTINTAVRSYIMNNELSELVVETVKNALKISPEDAELALMDAAISMKDKELSVVAKRLLKDAAPMVLHSDVSRPTLLYGLLSDDELVEIIFKAYLDTQKQAQGIVRGESLKVTKNGDPVISTVEDYLLVWENFCASVNGYLFNDLKSDTRTPAKAFKAILNRDEKNANAGKGRIGEQIVAMLMMHAYPAFRLQCAASWRNIQDNVDTHRDVESGVPSFVHTKAAIYDEENEIDHFGDREDDIMDTDEDAACKADIQWVLGTMMEESGAGMYYNLFVDAFDKRMMRGKIFCMAGPEDAFVAALETWIENIQLSDLSDCGPLSFWLLLDEQFLDYLPDLLSWLPSMEKRRIDDIKTLENRMTADE